MVPTSVIFSGHCLARGEEKRRGLGRGKDVIEEKLFDRRHDLFTDLSARIHGYDEPIVLRRGRETRRSMCHSKDYRPDLPRTACAPNEVQSSAIAPTTW